MSPAQTSIAQVVVALPVEGPFDYRVPVEWQQGIQVGQRVRISFLNRSVTGFVVGLLAQSTIPNLKPILEILDSIPVLDDQMLILTRQFADHYGCSWGEAIEVALPAALRQKKISSFAMPIPVADGKDSGNQVLLCHDEGRSARWPFLIDKIQRVWQQGRDVIFLVPERHLIAHVLRALKSHLTPAQCEATAVFDKDLGFKEELQQWIRAKEGRARMVIGTRSAVFAPLPRLGLIIVEEEENSAYKQEQSPAYHAHQVAQMRSHLERAQLIFVSSAPSAEIWQQTQPTKVVHFPSKDFAPVQFIDLSYHKLQGKSLLSFPLQNAIQQALAAGEKVVLFLNRKGFHTLIRCNQCEFILKCPDCESNLSYFYEKKIAVCPRCHHSQTPPRLCPGCHGNYLRYLGAGIEKIESEMARVFPSALIAHFDRESEKIPAKAQIIVATQAILRVIDHGSIGLVGVLQMDAELNRLDFRASQRAFSLLIHLRQMAKDKVVVQTYQPEHYALQFAAKGHFEQFYQEELKLRQEFGFPPFQHWVMVVCRGRQEEAVFAQAQLVYEKLQETQNSDGEGDVEILEPRPDIQSKLRGQYRKVVLLKGQQVELMVSLVRSVLKSRRGKKGVTITINVDT